MSRLPSLTLLLLWFMLVPGCTGAAGPTSGTADDSTGTVVISAADDLAQCAAPADAPGPEAACLLQSVSAAARAASAVAQDPGDTVLFRTNENPLDIPWCLSQNFTDPTQLFTEYCPIGYARRNTFRWEGQQITLAGTGSNSSELDSRLCVGIDAGFGARVVPCRGIDKKQKWEAEQIQMDSGNYAFVRIKSVYDKKFCITWERPPTAMWGSVKMSECEASGDNQKWAPLPEPDKAIHGISHEWDKWEPSENEPLKIIRSQATGNFMGDSIYQGSMLAADVHTYPPGPGRSNTFHFVGKHIRLAYGSHSKQNFRCAEFRGNGVAISAAQCSPWKPNQHWQVEEFDDGYSMIRSLYDQTMCMSLVKGVTLWCPPGISMCCNGRTECKEDQVRALPCAESGLAEFKWSIEVWDPTLAPTPRPTLDPTPRPTPKPTPLTTGYLKNILNGFCIDVEGHPPSQNGDAIQTWTCEFDKGNEQTDQRWTLTSEGFIRNNASNKCIDVSGSPPDSMTNGRRIQTFDCETEKAATDTDQRWELGHDGFIHNQANLSKCIDVNGAPGKVKDLKVQIWDCELAFNNNETDQRWAFEALLS